MGWRPAPRWDRTNRHWYVTIRGTKHYLGRDPAVAHRRFASLIGQPTTHHSRPQPILLAEAVAAYLQDYPTPMDRERLTAWVREYQDIQLTDLTTQHLAEYAAAMKRRKLSAWTMRHNVRLAMRLCRWLHDRGWLSTLPRPPKLDAPKRSPRDVAPPTLMRAFKRLQSMRETHAVPLVRFIVATGARPSEACLLQWSEIRWDRGCCELERGKTWKRTGRVRRIYLTPPAIEVLDQLGRCDSGYVFTSRLHRPYTPGGLRAILRRCGIQGAQCLRHTFAQSALEQIPIEEVSTLLGHAKITTTQIYADVRQERARRAAQSLIPPGPSVALPATASTSAPVPASPAPAAMPRRRRKPARARTRRAG